MFMALLVVIRRFLPANKYENRRNWSTEHRGEKVAKIGGVC